MSAADPALTAFQWKQQPQAERLVMGLLETFLSGSAAGRKLQADLAGVSGNRIQDWVDSHVVPHSQALQDELLAAGFKLTPQPGAELCYSHDGGLFPAVVLNGDGKRILYIKADSVADYVATHQLNVKIEGEPLAAMRRATVADEGGYQLAVMERHGYRGFSVPSITADYARKVLHHYEAFRTRRRDFTGAVSSIEQADAMGFELANKLIDAAISDLGRDRTCDLWFAGEREYWQRRNRAAQVQYGRQNKLGLGWANHDHHTYRCSRRNFMSIVATWEKLGFACRERYHAGMEAGWGAQVMESAVTGITTFNDVDLTPDELFFDFAHKPLTERKELSTVGLWCELHGDSFLEAGMHHLECQFDFNSLRKQLEEEHGIKTMKPFTTFSYLTQAFTEGERFKVAEHRLKRLLAVGQINEQQAQEFRTAGALGSHLENLERNEGFKGFNQKGVSEIIAATDARKHAGVK